MPVSPPIIGCTILSVLLLCDQVGSDETIRGRRPFSETVATRRRSFPRRRKAGPTCGAAASNVHQARECILSCLKSRTFLRTWGHLFLTAEWDFRLTRS